VEKNVHSAATNEAKRRQIRKRSLVPIGAVSGTLPPPHRSVKPDVLAVAINMHCRFLFIRTAHVSHIILVIRIIVLVSL
jgi:hypothetical protein